jgi:hypothetical protein
MMTNLGRREGEVNSGDVAVSVKLENGRMVRGEGCGGKNRGTRQKLVIERPGPCN